MLRGIDRSFQGDVVDNAHIRQCVEGLSTYLAQNPEKGRVTEKPAVATVVDGLRCRAEGPNGEVLVTDMPRAIGGGGAEPTPGWFLRAALANCDATVIAMRAAQLGITLTRLEVTVDCVADNRGILGVGDAVPPGPQSMRIRVALAADGASPGQLRDIVEWAEAHSPVGDALRRALPVSMEILTS